MRGRNAYVPENNRIDFRVGINVGDVIIEGDDIHGDGHSAPPVWRNDAPTNRACLGETTHHPNLMGKYSDTKINWRTISPFNRVNK